MADFLESKIIRIKEKDFVISKFPAFKGLEIMTKIPMAALPKLGDHPELMNCFKEALNFVAVQINKDVIIKLETEELINAHGGEWEDLVQLLTQLFSYNCSFFHDGRLQKFLMEHVQTFAQSIMKTSTGWLDQLLQKIEPHLKS